MITRPSKWVAVALALFLSCQVLLADVRSAMLYSTGPVFVNDSSVVKTSLFPGDKLRVPERSTATITMGGTSILVVKQSALTFKGDTVVLEPQSVIAVTTNNSMTTDVLGIHITPKSAGPAQYQVARYNGEIVVNAVRGDVLFADGHQTYVVPEGEALSVGEADPQKPGAVPATTGRRWKRPPAWLLILIGAGVTGAAATAAYLTTDKPVSPAVP